jgi:RNA recognition motif-containing protein
MSYAEGRRVGREVLLFGMQLERFEMLEDKDTKRFRGQLIVVFKRGKDAMEAMKRLSGSTVDGRTIRVEPLMDRRKSGARGESR